MTKGHLTWNYRCSKNVSCVIEFLHEEKMASIDIHQCMQNVDGDQIEDVCTVRWKKEEKENIALTAGYTIFILLNDSF